MAKARYFKIGLESVIVIGLLAAMYCTEINLVKFHGDESHWIGTSDVFEAFFTADFDSPVWKESYWTLTQPPIARYVIGLGRKMGGYGATDINPTWEWRDDEITNIRNGKLPSNDLLWWSRLPMAILAVFSLFVGFVLARRLAGTMAAYAWLVLVMLNPYFLLHLRRAMGEASLLASIILVICACYMSARSAGVSHRKWYWTTFLWLGVVGVGAGVAGSAKLNGLAAGIAGLALVVAMALRLRRPAAHKCLFAGCGALIVVVFTSCTFVGLNPYLWSDVDRRIGNLFRHRVKEMKVQVAGSPQARFDSTRERVARVRYKVFQKCAALSDEGMLIPNILLTVTGMCVVIARARRWLLNRDPEPGPMVVLLVGIITAGPSFLTPLDWERYYLLPIFFSTLFIAVAIAWYVKLICLLPDAVCRRLSPQRSGG